MLNQVCQGKCTLEQVVKWMSEEPARVWQIKNKGRIEVGYDADLTLIDLSMTQAVLNETQETKCGWSPWHGTELTGWPVATWVMGQQVFRMNNGQSEFDSSVLGQEIEYKH